MSLLNKLKQENVEILLNNKDESPTNYERSLEAFTKNNTYWDLPLSDVVAIIRMAELEDCAVGIANFINYFKND